MSAVAACAAAMSGCVASGIQEEKSGKVWGRRGISEGRFQKPRAIAIDSQDRLFIVDMTGRIQVFTRDGEFLHGWKMPKIDTGRPVGLGIHQDGSLMVADTHNFRVLFFTAQGEPLEDRTIGGNFGREHGQFGLVTDIVQDSKGDYYIGEYGDNDRIQKFSADGQFVYQIGSHGTQLGEFLRPQTLDIDSADRLYVADSCNHRVQVFDVSGDQAELIDHFGEQGVEPGQMRYPYGLALDGEDHVYVCEFGNHRVQKLTLKGEPLDSFGVHGRRELGEFQQPWAIAFDSTKTLHILDSYNHRVQSVRF